MKYVPCPHPPVFRTRLLRIGLGRLSKAVRPLTTALLLAASAALFAADPSAPTPVVGMSIETATSHARAFLASLPAEKSRDILGIQFVPPHGKPGPGYWLVDLTPYPSDQPSPAQTITSLLIAVDSGKVEPRGGRKKLDPEEAAAIRERAQTLRLPAAK